MTAAALRDHATDAALAAGLAVARRAVGDEVVVIATSAPLITAAQIVEAWGDDSVFAWTGRDGLTLVGVGVAREVRGRGGARWDEVTTGTRGLRVAAAVIDGEEVALGALGLAKPRFVGGAAFAPGAAERAPWTGFGDAWFALPRWTYASDGKAAWLVLAVAAREADEAARWQRELARHREVFATAIVTPGQPAIVEHQPASADEWRARVTAITTAIARGTCSKIVAARTHGLVLAGPSRPGALLAALDTRQPECTRVLVRPPAAGALVAATPEQLVKREGALVTCDALAGTVRLTDSEGLEAAQAALMDSSKDRWEHAIVVDAIRAALASVGAEIAAPAEPGVKVLRQMLHLHTPFRATLREPTHVLALAEQLHPTPAMGGTPTPVAIEWIREHEPARGWYSAPVGWFDLDGNGEFVVAIRSGVLAGNRVHLWAGAGIVAGSDPDRELAETELKLRAILGALEP